MPIVSKIDIINIINLIFLTNLKTTLNIIMFVKCLNMLGIKLETKKTKKQKQKQKKKKQKNFASQCSTSKLQLFILTLHRLVSTQRLVFTGDTKVLTGYN